jgi:RNA polymerase sigma-70 factor (ECF subfamily)
MEPGVLSPAIAATMEDTVEQLQDFDRLVGTYRPAVFRFILASLRDRDAAESLTQDCFFRAFRGRAQFRGDAAVKTWLMQIAVNLIRDLTRTRRFQFWRRAAANGVHTEDLLNTVSKEVSPEATTLRKEQLQAIWKATEKLPERQRAVFLLRFVEDMELLDIAEVLGMTEGTVKKHLFRALHTVRERMRKLS